MLGELVTSQQEKRKTGNNKGSETRKKGGKARKFGKALRRKKTRVQNANET